MDHQGILGPLYGKWNCVNENNISHIYHKTVFDYKSLEIILIANNFKEIKRYDWRNTIHADFDDYSQAYIPHMDKEGGKLMSLNIEATKN